MNKAQVFLFSCLSLFAAANAHAQWPEKPVRIVVGSSAGGVTDAMARLVATGLSERFGQSFVVENRAGASGTIALNDVHRAAPDGYTLMMSASNTAVFKELYGNLGFDPIEDFVPIVNVANSPVGISVHSTFPAQNLKDFIAYARTHDVSYASCGPGTTQHLAAEYFRGVAGLTMTHIPYKGCGQALPDVLAGQVPIFFTSIPNILEARKTGRIAPIAITSQVRSPLLPDTPTLVEAGYQDVTVDAWFGLTAAKGTPQNVVDKVNAAVNDMLRQPSVRQKMAAQYVDPAGGTAESFGTLIRRDSRRFGEIVRKAGMQVTK